MYNNNNTVNKNIINDNSKLKLQGLYSIRKNILERSANNIRIVSHRSDKY